MKDYPNITWGVFEAVNEDATHDFEKMCRRIFISEYLKDSANPHNNYNNKGIEVLPVLEPIRDDGQPRKRISFQAKYASSPQYAYGEFKKSAKITAKEYKGQLDLVYLFCNKTLTTDSKGYQAIVRIHKEAGIDVEPVSDDAILILAAKYDKIANYFFRPRTTSLREYSSFGVSAAPAVIVKVDSGDGEVCTGMLQLKPINEQLLKELVKEKSATCRRYACSMDLDTLRTELDNLLPHDIEQLSEARGLFFIKLLLELRDGKDVSAWVEKCEDKRAVDWIIEYYKQPRRLDKGEYLLLDPVTQIFVADKMFTSSLWKEFTDLYRDVREQISPEIKKQFVLYYGLSLFNLQNNTEASDVLHGLYDTEKEDRFLFYALCADVKAHNVQYQCGRDGNAEELRSLLERLEVFKELKQYSQQELLVASLFMEACYHLGMSYDNAFIEKAIERYRDYPDDIRNNKAVRFYYALCLEMNGDRSDAIEVYASLDWKNEPAFAERYTICCILAEQPDRAVSVYEELPDRNTRMESVYLFALNRSGDSSYEEKLRKAVEIYKDDLEAVFNIAYFIDGEEPYKDIVIPVLKTLINDCGVVGLRPEQVIHLAVLVAHFGEIELIETVLGHINDPEHLNGFALNEIYRAIAKVANREYIKQDKVFEKPADFKAAERIADRMLGAVGETPQDVAQKNRERFLHVKVLCAGAEQLPYKSLKYSKELFEITESVDLARNIVGLLVDTKVKNPSEYAPYLDTLKESDKPDHCMVMAAAMLLIGREDTSEYYAYKALYLLNGEDDYNVFREYFNYCNYNMRWISQEYQLKSVRSGTVVSLTEVGTADASGHLVICLDSEAEFSDRDNRSMDIEHIIPADIDYMKLYNSGLGQERVFRGKRYKIDQITPRVLYGLHYVFRKAQEKPDEFSGVLWMFDTQDAEELIGKLREMDAERTEHIRSLLDSYNFRDNQLGLPVDSIASGDYDRYIGAFQYCLYAKDEAFYAGQPVFEDETGQKYVPALSTLVLVALLDRFDLLDAIKDEMIIPESYISFMKERYERSYTNDSDSRSTLFFDDGKPILQEMDTSIPEIWERILVYCKGLCCMEVSNEERVSLDVKDGFTAERLMIGFKLSFIHLDSLALAVRARATYLCDDLFFRKIASCMNIRNINTVSIVEHYTDTDTVTDFILELSKTNYIYLPLLSKDDEQAGQLIRNVMDGEKKRLYYTVIINRLQEIREQFLRDLYGDEYVDRLLEGGAGE